MTPSAELATDRLLTTDGEIAFINLESARQRSWSQFFTDPQREGAAEAVVEHEQLTAQFLGDVCALDRLESLASSLAAALPSSARTALIQARVSSVTHRFTDARYYLAQAEVGGAPIEDVGRLRLNIDQACAVRLDEALRVRRELARRSGRLEDLVALGALLADLGTFADADHVYGEALRRYQDVSPFPVAWVCFQLGALWGELVPEPQADRAAQWYRKAIAYLPAYTKARVHLAEICLSEGRAGEAEALLAPALASRDPEVHWRLADALTAAGKSAEAGAHNQAARSGFDALLHRHLLAFADHGAEFYAGSGNDWRRALELARVNVANRPTLRALEQAHHLAMNTGDLEAASELLVEAMKRWGGTLAFRSSPLARCSTDKREEAAA
jgi:tetratricopeptide (TPR) repeat protein